MFTCTRNIGTMIALILSIITGFLAMFDLISHGSYLGLDNKIMVIGFSLIAFLLILYSWAYLKSVEIIGTIFYFLATIFILLANNFITLICAWEMAALSAILILAANNPAISSILRYATLHFIGGTLIIAAVPYNLMFTEINHAVTLLNNTQLSLLGLGILINCGAFPLSTWVTESYPAASPHGMAILQVFVTKSALVVLSSLFHSYEILIIIGLVTALYALIYSIPEWDLRRILAYNTVGQMGLMIASVGFGGDITAYLFSSMIYQTLMYLVVHSVISSTGKENLQELGGLLKKMPLITIISLIGLLTFAAMPFTINFNAKHMITTSIDSPLFLILFLTLSFGLIMSSGIRVVYFTFFHSNDYQGSVSKMKLSSTISLILISLLCITPVARAESAYSVTTILEQVFFFSITFIIFYSIKLLWYKTNIKLINLGLIYEYLRCLLSKIRLTILKLQDDLYCLLDQKIISVVKRLYNLTFEPISYTILGTMIVIGILVYV